MRFHVAAAVPPHPVLLRRQSRILPE